ncbi:ECF transporter S component [Streptococcus pneumoniae]
MSNKRTYKLVILAILTALSVTLGYFLKIPTPTGILTLLDAGIFFTAFYFGSKEGALVGGLSGFLIDLLAGYPQWMFFSLIIHGLQGYFAGFRGTFRWLGLVLASFVMVSGYALASSWMNGWGAALPEILPNLSQNLLGMILGWGISQTFKKSLGDRI